MERYRFCPGCGEELEERFKFCPCCGANTSPADAAAPAAPPQARARESKVTPISSESRRMLEMFDAEFQALKVKREKRKRALDYVIKSAFTPKVQIAIAAVSALVFIGFIFGMLWVYRVLSANLQNLTR
jgi:hypothetical protein